MTTIPCPTCRTPLSDPGGVCATCGPANGGNVEATMRAELQTALGEGYRVGPRIGRGGSATIYAARDLHLGRDVAVKVLDPMVEAPEVRERFRREARAVARLRHPNVVPIFLVSERPGLSYFVMPLIEGASLAAVLAREGPLSIEEARRVLLEAASGLEAAHRAGIVHRDIKPENVMLEGPDRRVVLMDFGIARAIDGDERKLTMDGALVGTPEYMSPEQAAADPAVDARSDVYSLGIVGYQLLTGRVPFAADALAAILFKHLSDLPTCLCSGSASDWPPSITS